MVSTALVATWAIMSLKFAGAAPATAPAAGWTPNEGMAVTPAGRSFIVEIADTELIISASQKINGCGDHGPRLLHHLQVGLIRAVGLSHVCHLYQHVDIRLFDHAVLVGSGISRIVLDWEGRLILPDILDRYRSCTE